MRKVTLRRTGGSLAATIPSELAERYHLEAGDEVFVIATENGVLITPFDPSTDRALLAYRKLAKKYRQALRDLGNDFVWQHPSFEHKNPDELDVFSHPEKYYDDE